MVDLPSNMPLWDTVSSLFQLQPHPNTFLIFFDICWSAATPWNPAAIIIAHHCPPNNCHRRARSYGHTTLVGLRSQWGAVHCLSPSCSIQDSGYEFWLPKQTPDISWQFINGIAPQLQRCTIFFEGSSSVTMSHSWVPWRAWVFKHLQNSVNGTTSRCGISPLNAPDFLCEQRHKSQDKCLPYILFRLFKC